MLRPKLLTLGGEDRFIRYERDFNQRYCLPEIRDARGHLVTFDRSRCWHVCYTTNPQSYNGGNRNNWSQDRAEHIPCILPVLADPGTEIRPNKNPTRITYLIRFEPDVAQKVPQSFYCAIGEPMNKGEISFITAFPITHQQYIDFRKLGKALYPIK